LGRIVYAALPALAAVAVATALGLSATRRAEIGIVLYGGPTSSRFQSWRVEALDVSNELAPAPGRTLRLRVATRGRPPRSLSITTDAEGQSWSTFVYSAPPFAPLEVSVSDAERGSVAHGEIALEPDQWAAGASKPPAWSEATESGTLALRIAAARGRFAVPFFDRLLFEVRDAAGPLGDVALLLAGDGVELAQTRVVTDGDGRASVSLRPLEHVARVRARAQTADGRALEAHAVLPVLPGALHAELRGGRLIVTSPIERRHAFVALVARDSRYFANRVALEPAAGGTALASIPLPPLPSQDGPLWAVVSSTAGFDSPASCGWPLHGAGSMSPLATFDRGEQRLFDGVPQARVRYSTFRGRVRVLLAIVLGCAAALAAATLSVRAFRSRRRLARHLDAHFDRGEVSGDAPLSGIATVVLGAFAVAMGFALLALFALYRVG
jgi:hypothetical protein